MYFYFVYLNLNMKFVVMPATLPKIGDILDNKLSASD